MPVDTVTGLPAVLTTGAVGAVVSGLLSLFAPLLLRVPGLRPNDASRNALMRSLVFVLTLAGLLALAWTQGIIISPMMYPALVLYAAGGATLAHLVYTGAKSVQSGQSASTPAPSPVPDAPAPSVSSVPAS